MNLLTPKSRPRRPSGPPCLRFSRGPPCPATQQKGLAVHVGPSVHRGSTSPCSAKCESAKRLQCQSPSFLAVDVDVTLPPASHLNQVHCADVDAVGEHRLRRFAVGRESVPLWRSTGSEPAWLPAKHPASELGSPPSADAESRTKLPKTPIHSNVGLLKVQTPNGCGSKPGHLG